ncbi:hypothetical protein LUPAC06_02953 [Micromonospora saelicesensis]|nr:hypothetical protein LUPAC06_02953 [Micromonospora saelicesensis]
MTQRSQHQRGRCPLCKRLVALTADGRVGRHNGTIRAYAPPEECPGGGQRAEASALVRRPYDLRHAAASLWLNAGVPPTEVARRLGHGVAVLLRV